MEQEQDQSIIWQSLLPFAFVLLHIYFCAYTTPRICFFPNLQTSCYTDAICAY